MWWSVHNNAGDGESVRYTHGPWWLAATSTVPSWTLPRRVRQCHRQRSSHTFLTRYIQYLTILTFCVVIYSVINASDRSTHLLAISSVGLIASKNCSSSLYFHLRTFHFLLIKLPWRPVLNNNILLEYSLLHLLPFISTHHKVNDDINGCTNATALDFSKRAFCHASPTVWNSLPQSVISDLTVTTGTFKHRLKSAMYTRAFLQWHVTPTLAILHNPIVNDLTCF